MIQRVDINTKKIARNGGNNGPITKENGYYSVESPEHFDVIIGDEIAATLKPTLKIKKWNNECKLELKFDKNAANIVESSDKIDYEINDKIVHMEPKYKRIKEQGIDYINLDFIDPKLVPAEYELDKHLTFDKITVMSYFTSECIMLFGNYPATKFLDLKKVDVPLLRSDTIATNPSYGDKGLKVVDIHIIDKDNAPFILDIWQQAIIQVFGEAGVTVYPKDVTRLYYKNKKGEEYKLSSPALTGKNIFTYINLDCEYTKICDYYTDLELCSKEPSHGIQKDFPDIKDSIIDACIVRFANLMLENLTTRSFTQDETNELNRVADLLYSNTDWILNANRSDVRGLEDNQDKVHFDITFNSKPSSSIFEIDISTENIIFYKQHHLTKEEKDQGVSCPSYIEGSYAVYHKKRKNLHTNDKDAEKYRTYKFCQIYRPALIDTDNNKIWADLEIIDNKLRILMDKDFLDNAVYPVRLDPTIGYTTAGSKWVGLGSSFGGYYTDPMYATIAIVSRSGIASTISAFTIQGDLGTGNNFKMALYDNTDGNSFLEETVQISSRPPGWRTSSLNSPTFFASHEIAVTLFSKSAQYQDQLAYDDGDMGDGQNDQTKTYGDGFPDPHEMTDDAKLYSLYATYVVAGMLQVRGNAELQTKGVELQIKE